MGAINAPPPEGKTVTVQPEQMVELLSQWMNHQRTGQVVVPLEVEFHHHEIEFVPVRITRSARRKRSINPIHQSDRQ